MALVDVVHKILDEIGRPDLHGEVESGGVFTPPAPVLSQADKYAHVLNPDPTPETPAPVVETKEGE